MFCLTHTYIPSDIPYIMVIILKGVHRQCNRIFFRYFFDHLNYSWTAKKNFHFISVILKFTRNYVVIYDKGSLCTLGFKKCLLLKYITISIHQTVILYVHSILRSSESFDGGGAGSNEVMCTYGGGGAGKLHVLVGGVGELHVPVILLLWVLRTPDPLSRGNLPLKQCQHPPQSCPLCSWVPEDVPQQLSLVQ